MRKQSLIHLHQLFTEVRREFETRDVVDTSAFVEYDTLNLNGNDIHRRKTTHEDAIFLLLDGLTEPEETDTIEHTEPPLPS